MGSRFTQTICAGSGKYVKALSLFYKIWRQFGDKLGLGDMNANAEPEDNSKYTKPLEYRIANVHRHLCWYVGHYAYNQIKIEKVNKPKPNKDEEKTKEQKRDEILEMVVQSNLLAGGIEDKYLHGFSQPSKDKMLFYAHVLGDEQLKNAVEADPEDELAMAGTGEDELIESILHEGREADTDLAIRLI
jgi:hypothetical protein